MIKKDKKQPGLRFPGFTDDWEQRKLIEVCDYVDYRGKTPTKTENGIFLVTAKNVKDGFIDYETSKEYISENAYEEVMRRGKPEIGDVLITTEAPCGNVAQVNKADIALAQRIIKYRGHIGVVDNTYLKYYLLSPEFQKILNAKSSGGTVQGIKGSILHQQKIIYPSYEEQKKIGQHMDSLDHLITLHQRKCEQLELLKKGLMQKIFSQEVRFKADDGSEFPEWEEKKLSEMFKKVVEKNRLDLPPLTIVQGYGTIRRDESERRIAYDEKGLKNYKAVQKDDFIVHLRSFEGGLEIANQDGIVSPAYHVYRGNDEVHPSFYYPYFRSSSFIKGKLSICVTGVRDGKNIEMGSFDELLIPHPCLAEQQKIADCLSSLDEVIEKQKATLAAWKELKKGLLQQMFI